MSILALEFPPVSHLFEWPDMLFDDTAFAVNKVVLINLVAMALTLLIFFLAGRKRDSLVPAGIQHVAESGVQFVEEGIVMQTMGEEGKNWVPFLTTMFFFVFFNNIFEVIPFVQFPSTSRMALPATLAIIVWVLFNYVGMKHQGVFGYLKSSLFPPGVPKAMYVLVTPIEFVSTFLVRPFSLAVRLFANLMAGHLFLVTFAVLSASLWDSSPLIAILPFSFVMLILLTGFEILVAVLQAFIFTILTAVYIGGAMHPEH